MHIIPRFAIASEVKSLSPVARRTYQLNIPIQPKAFLTFASKSFFGPSYTAYFAQHTWDIAQHTLDIAQHTRDIAQHSLNIAKHTWDIT